MQQFDCFSNNLSDPQEEFRIMAKNILLLDSKKVSAKQKFILSIIDDFSRQKGYCSLSNSQIAEHIHDKYPKNINRDIKKLEDLNLIKVERKKHRKIYPTIPDAIKGFDLYISEAILKLNASYEAKIVFALLDLKEKQSQIDKFYSIKTLAKYAGIS